MGTVFYHYIILNPTRSTSNTRTRTRTHFAAEKAASLSVRTYSSFNAQPDLVKALTDIPCQPQTS